MTALLENGANSRSPEPQWLSWRDSGGTHRCTHAARICGIFDSDEAHD
jgi:hypothetical protein